MEVQSQYLLLKQRQQLLTLMGYSKSVHTEAKNYVNP